MQPGHPAPSHSSDPQQLSPALTRTNLLQLVAIPDWIGRGVAMPLGPTLEDVVLTVVEEVVLVEVVVVEGMVVTEEEVEVEEEEKTWWWW